MTDLEKAKDYFYSQKASMVLCKDDEKFITQEKGLTPLINLIESGDDYFEYSACDKVVGRAAAFLYVLLGVKEIHAKIMAKLAIQILDKAEIKYSADEFVDTILDDQLKDTNPLEEVVLRSGSANNALRDLKAFLKL